MNMTQEEKQNFINEFQEMSPEEIQALDDEDRESYKQQYMIYIQILKEAGMVGEEGEEGDEGEGD